jgi:hypothetical protein
MNIVVETETAAASSLRGWGAISLTTKVDFINEMKHAMRYRLDSVVERHREAPDTFEIPSAHRRRNLARGMYARLLFFFGAQYQAERMWVKVEQVDIGDWAHERGTKYTGVLANVPTQNIGITLGDYVTFGPEHVADIYQPAPVTSPPAAQPSATRAG